jgi:hypothetical protein
MKRAPSPKEAKIVPHVYDAGDSSLLDFVPSSDPGEKR